MSKEAYMLRSRSLLIGLAAVFAGSALAALPAGSAQEAVKPPDRTQSQAEAQAPQAEPLTPEKRADIFMARKMYREAIDIYKTCKPTAVVLNKLGIAYHQLSDLDTAKKFYQRAIKANPKYAEAVNNLGTVHYAQKSYRRAVSQYKKALKLSPDSASIYSNLGTALFARKKYDDATKAYQQALALDPEIFERRSSFGVLLQDRNVEERAKYHYYLAKMYAQAGQNERALLYIRRSLEEGFKDKKKYLEEPEFAKVREMQEFKDLMAQEQRVL
jgi:tetratricopeptide (TPR) repeat protein